MATIVDLGANINRISHTLPVTPRPFTLLLRGDPNEAVRLLIHNAHRALNVWRQENGDRHASYCVVTDDGAVLECYCPLSFADPLEDLT